MLGVTGAISDYTQELKDAGYAMNDSIGLFGAESAFESYLRGTNGRRVVSFNDQGKVTGETYSVEPVPGATVSLTIDEDFQRNVEDALASVIEGLTAKDGITRGGAAAVIQVGTGEVLALASYPDYDLSRYFQDYQTLSSDSEGRPLLNRATNGTYPPGSTLKPITAFAALDSGVTTVSETLFDSGHWTYPSSWGGGLNCWNRAGHGRVTVTSAITGSCNYYFAEMGYRMGMTTLRDYYSAFGLGSKTGIEIGDAAGPGPLGGLRPGQPALLPPAAGQRPGHPGLRRAALPGPPSEGGPLRRRRGGPGPGGQYAPEHHRHQNGVPGRHQARHAGLHHRLPCRLLQGLRGDRGRQNRHRPDGQRRREQRHLRLLRPL